MSRKTRISSEVFAVKIEPHHLADGRYKVPGRTIKVRADNENDARLNAIREAHVAARVPGWKPLVRESWAHATISKVVAPRLKIEYLP
jgi:predicted RecB family endonuclease